MNEHTIKVFLVYCGVFALGYFFHAYIFSTGHLASTSMSVPTPMIPFAHSSSGVQSLNYIRNLQTKSDGLSVFMDQGASGACVIDPDLLLQYAIKSETDKVTNHRYDLLFTRYLSSIRCRKIRFLEIGLGCGYGNEGASVRLWSNFFPQAEFHWIEYDQQCVKKFQAMYPQYHFYQGDQSNATRLLEIVDEIRNQMKEKGEYFNDDGIGTGLVRPFDLIIDDGGHSDKQQIVSLETLYSSIKYGGYYFLEDLHCSFDPPRNNPSWNRCSKGVRDGIAPAASIIGKYIELLHEETVEPNIPSGFFYDNNKFLHSVRSINCQASMCVFEKFNAKEIQHKRPFFPPNLDE